MVISRNRFGNLMLCEKVGSEEFGALLKA